MKSAEYFITNTQPIFFVPRPGVEPGWMLLHWCLRPARVYRFRHLGNCFA